MYCSAQQGMTISGFRKPTAVGTRTWPDAQIVKCRTERNSLRLFCSKESRQRGDMGAQLRRSLRNRQKPKPILISPALAITAHNRNMSSAHRPGSQIAGGGATATAAALPAVMFPFAKKGSAAMAIKAATQTAKPVLEFCRPPLPNTFHP